MLEALAAIIKALLYAALLTATGAVVAEVTLRTTRDGSNWLRRLARRASVMLVALAVGGAFVLFLRLGGRWDEATTSALLSSSVGAATGLQLAGAMLLLVSAADATSSAIARLGNAAVVLASFAFNGHAAVVGLVEGLIVMAHATAAAWWVGSLGLLRHACVHWTDTEVAALVQRFSVLAVRVIGGLAMAGLLLIAVLVDFSREPWITPYVRLLASKLGIVLLVLAIAAYNRFRLTPWVLAGNREARRKLSRSVAMELVLIGVVLAVTAVLTTYTSPHE
jgi:putative copper export protein